MKQSLYQRAIHLLGHRGIIAIIAGLLALRAFYHLLAGVYYFRGDAGFDFRYFWVAGRMWADGRNPYGSDYLGTASKLIADGHIPEVWAYPPNWWPISSALGLLEIVRANLLWSLTGVALCFASSFLIASAFRWAHQSTSHPVRDLLVGAGAALPLIHFFGTSALEATSLTLAIGQTSLLIYFGIAALLYGIARGSRLICAIALSIIFLKPHIGLPFAALFLVYNSWSRQALVLAAAVSVIMAAPALWIDPLSPIGMLRNMARYDGIVPATLPQATTGLRLVIWEVFGFDLGGLGSGIIAALAAALVPMLFRRFHTGDDEQRILWWCTTATVATTIALAPLHYYDFVIAASLMPAVLVSPIRYSIVAILSTALILRADTLGKLTGLYDHSVGIFEGAPIATAGGFLLLIAALGAVGQLNSAQRRVAGRGAG